MTTRTVGANSNYLTIAAAIAVSSPGDVISVEAGYGNETAIVTVNNLFFEGSSASIGIALQLSSGIPAVTLLGTAPFEVRDAHDANAVVGNDGNNLFSVSSGNDVVTGGLGTDRLVINYGAATAAITGTAVGVTDGGNYAVTFSGVEDFSAFTGSGNDTLTFGNGSNLVISNAGDDTITLGDGPNFLNGGAGNDTITVGTGANAIYGGEGNETIVAGNGGNMVDGGGGNDSITTGSGDDVVNAGLGNDTVITGAGNDIITVDGGVDTVDAGTATDRLYVNYSSSTTAVTGSVTGTIAGGYSGTIADSASTSSVGFEGVESFDVITGSGNDSITTGDGVDVLSGGSGDDLVSGGGGNDTLDGGDGNDFHDGGAGYDTVNLTGVGRRAGSFAQEVDGDITFTRLASVDVYRNIEVMNFADGRMVFDAADPAAQVERLYHTALGRAADQDGLNAWISALNEAPLSASGEAFIDSSEFSMRYGSNLSTADFVEQLYTNATGRASDALGKASWVSAIDNATLSRAEVLVSFSEGGENVAQTMGLVSAGIWDLSEDAAFVARLYDTTFGRLPDQIGLSAWTSALLEAPEKAVAAGFLGSTEFHAGSGINPDNGAFVDLLYINALHRAADLSGRTAWVNALNDGALDRADLLVGFSESAEHKALTVPNIMSENPDQFGILFA